MRVPTCDLCNKPVGDNEYDGESHSYFSRHMACYSYKPDGQFVIVSERNGVLESSRTHLQTRAEEQLAYYRQWNPQLPPENFRIEEKS